MRPKDGKRNTSFIDSWYDIPQSSFLSAHILGALWEQKFSSSFTSPERIYASVTKNLRVNLVVVVPVATFVEPCRGKAVGHTKQDPPQVCQ